MIDRYQGSHRKPDAMQAFVQHVISSKYEDLLNKQSSRQRPLY